MKDIGVLLQQARESQNIEISAASAALKIKQRHLEAIEAGDTSELNGSSYVTGCIKSYANWLGLNGAEITSKFKKESIELKIGNNNFSSDGSPLFVGENKILFPEQGTPLVMFLFAFVVYLFWTGYNEPHDLSYNGEILKTENNINYPGFSYMQNDNRSIILLANAKSILTVTDIDGKKEVFNLNKDEIFFLPKNKDIFVTADKPEYVDVFLDNKNNKFLGTLKNISKL